MNIYEIIGEGVGQTCNVHLVAMVGLLDPFGERALTHPT